MTKSELRQYIRNKKREYSEDELKVLSQSIVERVLRHKKVLEADTLLLYYSLPDEVYTHDLIDELVAMGKTVLLPKVISDTEMSLHQYTSPTDLSQGAYGIMEPNTINHKPYTINLAIIPGMAFDKEGHRLGRGKGYYDRFLSALSSQLSALSLIGLCFPFQMVEAVPYDVHDIIMDEVIS